ncbi:MAG: hypothetical protein MUC29_02680 [Pyrinomonadaceae bacterium]|jgi:hypothetical protein|nr:hypothetical protein [Pyrinomonadaceae bacterium]
MRLLLSTFLVALFLSIPTIAQTREQAINEEELKLLAVGENDIELAKEQGFGVFKLLPRGKYEKQLPSIRGGGAYYSFYLRVSDYGRGSDIELQQNKLSVGFAGADYGFLKDLGKLSLVSVTKNNSDNFLLNYVPPTNEPDIRKEQRKANNYEVNGQIYKDDLPVIVGNTYLLRSISFGDSDILVAFNIHRQDSDGSLIIFWKMLEQFDTPKIITESKTDEELLQRLKQQFNREQYKDIQYEVNDMVVTLRGTTTKKDLPNVIYWANSFGARKVINLLEYK